jgi:hypothetical protein
LNEIGEQVYLYLLLHQSVLHYHRHLFEVHHEMIDLNDRLFLLFHLILNEQNSVLNAKQIFKSFLEFLKNEI